MAQSEISYPLTKTTTDSPPDPAGAKAHLAFPVVGIGSSAGGLRGLIDFFNNVHGPADMAYVVVSHLSPDHESRLDEVLQKSTPLPVTQVKERVAIEANKVYVISPKSDLSMNDGHLDPRPASGNRSERGMTIDRFFETLSDAHGNRAFGIVLSGTGSDGTNGAKAVKAAGGVTLAQEPKEAEYDTMPRNAIGSGAIDFVLNASEMPAKIQALWRSAKEISLPPLEDRPSAEDVAARAEDALRDVLSIVRARTGHDFTQYKRATLLRRLERRLQVNQLRDLPTYRDLLRESPPESRLLLRDLLISVTAFFRDPASFAALETQVIPALFQGRERGGKIRAWVAGCATGEEAYTIAMLLSEQAQRLSSPVDINVFATDIDEDALAVARAAFYPDTIKDQVSTERLRRFFTREPGGFRVQKFLREMVMFATHNVIQDPPFSRLDLICCRNLLIYLNRHVQEKVIDLLHFSLRPEGFLFLGMAESIDDGNEGFAVIDKAHRIYQMQVRGRIGAHLHALPTIGAPRIPVEVATVPGRRMVSYGELHHSLLEFYAPPSVVVDEHFDIVHLSETAGRFLQMRGGEPSTNLLRVAPESIRFELRAALDQALHSMKTVERFDLELQRGPQQSIVSIKVHPVREKGTARTYALVFFEEGAQRAQKAPKERKAQVPADSASEQLETRLVETQSQLRATVEQYEVQNEELKASNEELQATNEELRATSEELETGKEELQSINEELTTVNQELKNKVDEATRVNDDMQNLITSTELAVMFVDRELRLMRFTPLAQELFNVIPRDVGRPLLDVTHRFENVKFDEEIDSVLKTLRMVELEVRSTSDRWYLLRILPYRTTGDRIGGVVLTFLDITKRKEAEDEVELNRNWLQLVVDSVADYAILTIDPQGNIASWNAGAEKIFEYRADEAIGSPFSMLFTEEDRAAGVPAEELRAAAETGRTSDDRWQQRKDGRRFYASGVTALLGARNIGFVKLLRDLTEQHVAAERREKLLSVEQASRASAEEMMRLKDEFIATLSHELRNPLALILMQSELLQRAPELRAHPKLSSAVNVINQMVRAQSQFVEDMLDVSRARTGKLAIERQLVPLPYIIADSIGALRKEADENEITLDVQIGADPLIVAADAVRVRQIAWNLLSNAIKFTPHGGSVSVQLERDGNEARLIVADDGQGIDPEQLPRIFDWFRQGETGSKRRRGGMGIGLALVKQLVELHGGRVTAESDGLGKGARFIVWLPLQTSDETRVLAAAPSSTRAGERLKGLRVLVIDDAEANAEAMSELLRLEGADATMATSARAAIERARVEKFDVIVSDLAMPKMDGYEMLQQIRGGSLNSTTPAIAYSGYGGPEEVARSKVAGFEVHITKPVDLAHMVDAIDSLRRRAANDGQA